MTSYLRIWFKSSLEVFWQKHIDHLRPINDTVKVPDQSTSPPMPNLPILSTENTELLVSSL